jgi:hypothetical protein
MTQPDNSTPSLPRALTEEVACLGMYRVDDPFRDCFRDLEERARRDWLDAFAKPSKLRPQRKPSLETVLDQAKRAGARSVTVDGVTYTFGQADHLTDIERELTEFEARHGKA